jgi:hypothetical protein
VWQQSYLQVNGYLPSRSRGLRLVGTGPGACSAGRSDGPGATSGQHGAVSAAGPDAREAVAAFIAILSEATKVGGQVPRGKFPCCEKCAIARLQLTVQSKDLFIPNGPWFPGHQPFTA